MTYAAQAAAPAAGEAALLTDKQAAVLLNVGIDRLYELQRRPDFPRAIWLSPRGKRWESSELLTWARGQRERQS